VGFLSPWFLLGSLALGLPLWLHLLRQFKRTPQPFSSLMFFERRIQSSVKHRRLRYLALLAMRMALLALLALAFANPFINRTSTLANRRTMTVIAVDRSFSMRAGDHLRVAKEEAQRVIDQAPANNLALALAVDAHVESLTQPAMSKEGLKAAVNAIEPSDLASSFGEFTRALRSMEQTSGMHLDVHFISDMQETSMPSDFRDLQAGPYVSLHLHRIGEKKRPNWAVENVAAPAAVDGNEPARLTATIAGWNTPAAARRVFLTLDGKTLAAKDVSIPANGEAAVEFKDFAIPYGMHRGEIRLEAGDELPQDDGFTFSIEHQDPRKLLFLYAGTRLGDRGFYYKTALESGSHGSLSVEAVQASDAGERDFSPYAYLVLSDVAELDPKLADAICGYVEKGGAVLIALGPNTGRTGTIPLSKEQFSEQRQHQSAGYVDRESPAMAAGQFENVQFFETASFVAKPGARVLAKFADGSPLLVEERAGEGRKLIFASTFDNSSNDFALHASFVPFVVQTGRYLAGLEEGMSSVVAGTPVVLRHKSNAAAADVIGPDGKHELGLGEAAKTLNFEVVKSGFYEITRADGKRLLMAVHADRRESNLTAVSDETLELWRNTGDTKRGAETPVQRQTQTRPWSYWRYVLAVALGAALLESVFANRYLAGRSLKEERQRL